MYPDYNFFYNIAETEFEIEFLEILTQTINCVLHLTGFLYGRFNCAKVYTFIHILLP